MTTLLLGKQTGGALAKTDDTGWLEERQGFDSLDGAGTVHFDFGDVMELVERRFDDH